MNRSPLIPATLSDADCRDRLGLAWEEAAYRATRHTFAVQAWLPARAGQVLRFVGQGTQAVSNGMPVQLFNQALGADYPAVPDADAEIAAVRTFFEQRQTPWMWWIDPFARPENLFERMAQQGITSRGPLPAMMARLPAAAEIETPPGIDCWQACTTSELAQASMIRRIAFNFAPNAGLNYFEEQPESWLDCPTARLYMARAGSEGPPAAIGALIMAEGMAGIYIMATLPNHERQGLGRAVLLRIMAEAARMGYEHIVLTASRKGFGLYSRFGFEHIFSFEICEPH